jgi:hypothetical protein
MISKFFTISCGGSLVEADRKADGGSVASSDTGSVALKPLREAEAACSPKNETVTHSTDESQRTVITISLKAGGLRAAFTFGLTKT